MDARLTVTEADTRALRSDTEIIRNTIKGYEASQAHLTTWVNDLDNRDRRLNLHNFALKQDILRSARRMGTIRIDNQQISIYQDLSRYTLQARKALRPLTTALQAAGIPYRWGTLFPYAPAEDRTSASYGLLRTSLGSSAPYGFRKPRCRTGWLLNSCNKRQAHHLHHWAGTRAETGPNATVHGTNTRRDQRNKCCSNNTRAC
ncbi:Hypothetical predicted protein [Pelobates cultripes]|uniref:Uncharacterized protein n=1 Tax=Pelobates cultripes TaxID=61616 RepID=A0AAD1VV13_PELCU|nr:Hypothetical predicted protein [Pelobates cultripes]